MELNVHENTRLVEVWMTGAEKNDPAVQARLKALYANYRGTKYTVAVFQSGSADLYQSTRELLVHNRWKCGKS